MNKLQEDKTGGISFEFSAIIVDNKNYYEESVSEKGKTCRETAQSILDEFNNEEKRRYGNTAKLRSLLDVRLLKETDN